MYICRFRCKVVIKMGWNVHNLSIQFNLFIFPFFFFFFTGVNPADWEKVYRVGKVSALSGIRLGKEKVA